jgi:predicted O-methyltransferase YrrM/glycosyltransferase involved in cell wall biosynthesis
MQIFVLGMHGSGTSMLARLLNMMGVYFAPEHACTGSDQENSKGFWERRDVRQANDRLLQANRADWDRVGSFSTEKIPEEELKRVQQTIRSIVLELDAHRPWFVKEPRLCLLFPVWRPLLELPVCIHIYRDPLEVALSLRERNQLSVPLGLALWERYTLAAFGATAGLPRVLVPHAKLLEFPVKTLRWLAARLTEFGVRGLREPAEVEIEAFVRSDLHYHRLSVAFGAGNCLREHHQNLIELIDSGAILECGSDDLPAVSAYSMDLLAVHDSAGQKVAQQMEKLRENIVAVEKTLEDRSWRFGCNIAALQRTIEKKGEKARTLQKAVQALQRQLQQAEALRNRWQKECAKLNKWSERMLRDFGRVLRSNRWRIGCWLSFKRAGEKSKEAQRLSQLIASRPQPASGGRYVLPVQSSTEKGEPDGRTGAFPNSDSQSARPATAAAGSSMAATPQQQVAKPALNPLLDRGMLPKPVPKTVGRSGQSSAPPCSILFLMNLRAAGGGVNSIVQEANGLRKLGAAVQVAIRSQDESFYRERFPGVAVNLFHVSESMAELIGYARHFEFVVATAFQTVRTLKTLLEQASGVVPCYYIQDYEANFYHPSEPNYPEAVESYTLIPEMCYFAKTRWLCERVAQKHGVRVHKVEPSLDREIFFPDDRLKPGTPFVVCAMVRPMSEYRSPGLTFEILRRIKREFGERVEIRMFGLDQKDPFLDRQPADFEYKVLGILAPQAVASLMRESSLFIDASTYQAFGRSGLEAMACRCATILPSEGGISEYAVDGVNTLLAAPNDAGEGLRKVRRYISEPQLYQSIVEEGLKTASRYSIERACVSELQFFESLRRGTGAERSAAPCVARGKSPAVVSMHRYAVVDLGTKKGGAIDAFRRFAASTQMPVPSPAVCLGIDRDEQYRTEVTQKGYEFLAANVISPDFVWPEADHYLAWDFLEHLPDRECSKKVLIQICRHATASVWLRLPSFEQDSVTGEAALKKHGLRFAWSHWRGHPSHFLVEDAMQALHEGLKDVQWSYRLQQQKLIYDSNHPNVVPIGAPIDTVKYDPNLGMRPQVQFVLPIVGQWDLIVSIRRKTSGPQPGAPGAAHITSQRQPRGFVTHPETWMERDELGRERPYQPTITSFGQFINDRHRYYHECRTKGILIDVGIQGHLLREDALKLYEMAYYATGDILEFGTSFGLSTSILARAVRDAGSNSRIVTMELKQRLAEHARHTLTDLDLSRYVEFMAGDADASCQKLFDTGRKFHFAFIDHSHTYDDVSKASGRLSQLLTPGSFCLFHDYNSRWEGTADYGVYTAVAHVLDPSQFEFCGIYGCCGLFRRRDA